MSDQTLRHAWSRYGSYDAAAIDNQRRFLRLRRAVLALGVATAAVSLIIAADADSPEAPLRWIPFLLSLALAGLFAFAARVDHGTLWILCRRSADLVLREILLYRTRRARYRTDSPDQVLAERLFVLHRAAPPQIGGIKDAEHAAHIVRGPDGQPIAVAAGPDDGLCQLTAADYVRLRLDDQRVWYGITARRLRRQLVRLQIAGIVAGLAGAALAFAGGTWVAWVAVTTALAAAAASWTELRRLEPTTTGYEHAAVVLDDLLLWWYALSDHDRASDAAFDKLVAACESVIESENASWTHDMHQHVADLKAEAEQRAEAKR